MTASSAANAGSALANAASARQNRIAIRENNFISSFIGRKQRERAAANCAATFSAKIEARPAIVRRRRNAPAIARIECDRVRRRAHQQRQTAEEFLSTQEWREPFAAFALYRRVRIRQRRL